MVIYTYYTIYICNFQYSNWIRLYIEFKFAYISILNKTCNLKFISWTLKFIDFLKTYINIVQQKSYEYNFIFLLFFLNKSTIFPFCARITLWYVSWQIFFFVQPTAIREWKFIWYYTEANSKPTQECQRNMSHNS